MGALLTSVSILSCSNLVKFNVLVDSQFHLVALRRFKPQTLPQTLSLRDFYSHSLLLNHQKMG